MKLTIIIPIYNVEKYVNGTLSSIYCQGADENQFEVIVVNDGTPDNSMEIVEEFADLHTNLSIINQENQGLSAARNAGLRVARGPYVWFVDSDDQIENDSLLNLLALLDDEDSDILGFGITRVDEYGNFLSNEKPFLSKKDSFIYRKVFSGKCLYHRIHTGLVQRYLYKTSFLKEKNLSFFPDIWYEDDQFNVRAFFFANKVTIFDVDIYRYLIRNNGNIMSTVSMKSIFSAEKIIGSWLDFLSVNALTYQDKAIIYDAISEYCFFIFSFRKHHLKEYEVFIALNSAKYRKLAIKSTLMSLKYLSKRKISCFMAMFFCPSLAYKVYN